MKWLRWIKKQLEALKDSTRRFPLVILLVLLCTAVLIWIITRDDSLMRQGIYENDAFMDTLMRVLLSAGLGIPLLLGVTQTTERQQTGKGLRLLVQGLVCLFLIGYGLFLFPELGRIPIIRYVILLGASLLFMLIASFFPNRPHFALYTTGRLVRLFVTVLYALILMLSLFAILFTLDKLLNMQIESISYANTAAVVWMGFAPLFYIAGIPSKEAEPTLSDSPKTLRFLLFYILIPLLAIYGLILYAYTIRIIAMGEWPEGMVSSLMLSFATVSLFVLMLTKPLRKENRIAELFGKWFPKASLPLFIVLFLALNVRLRAYGITEARYFALVLAIWCCGAMLYAAFVRQPRTIVWAVSLAVVAVLSVSGFTSAWQVSIHSQNKRLEAVLSRSGMLSNGKVIPATAALAPGDKEQIAEVLRYFELNHSYDVVRALPSDFQLEKSTAVLGFDLVNIVGSPQMRYLAFFIDDSVIPVIGYDQLLSFGGNSKPASSAGLSVRQDYDKAQLILSEKGSDLWIFDMSAFLNDLAKRHGPDSKDLPQKELTIDAQTDAYSIRVVFTRIEGNLSTEVTDQDANTKAGYADGFVLLKPKP